MKKTKYLATFCLAIGIMTFGLSQLSLAEERVHISENKTEYKIYGPAYKIIQMIPKDFEELKGLLENVRKDTGPSVKPCHDWSVELNGYFETYDKCQQTYDRAESDCKTAAEIFAQECQGKVRLAAETGVFSAAEITDFTLRCDEAAQTKYETCRDEAFTELENCQATQRHNMDLVREQMSDWGCEGEGYDF